MLAQLQEQWLLKVTQNPAVSNKTRRGQGKETRIRAGDYKREKASRRANLPDIFEHVEHFGREVGVGHIEFGEICLQH